METFAFLVGFVALAVLALRFGQESRAGLRSAEQDLADREMTWTDFAVDQVTQPSSTEPGYYPTLALIEQALARPGTLTTNADASTLEAKAKELMAEYLSDFAWITGAVPEVALRTIVSRLDPSLATAPVRAELSPVVVGLLVAPAQTETGQVRQTSGVGRTATGFEMGASTAVP